MGRVSRVHPERIERFAGQRFGLQNVAQPQDDDVDVARAGEFSTSEFPQIMGQPAGRGRRQRTPVLIDFEPRIAVHHHPQRAEVHQAPHALSRGGLQQVVSTTSSIVDLLRLIGAMDRLRYMDDGVHAAHGQSGRLVVAELALHELVLRPHVRGPRQANLIAAVELRRDRPG